MKKVTDLTKNISNIIDDIRRNKRICLGLIIGFALIVFAVSFFSLLPQRYNLKAGDIAGEDILAPRRIIDTKMTDNLKHQAELKAEKIYDYVPDAYTNAREGLNSLFETIAPLKISQIDEKAAIAYNKTFGIDLEYEYYKELISLSKADLDDLKGKTLSALSFAYETEVATDFYEAKKQEIIDYIAQTDLSEKNKILCENIVFSALKPNMILNEEATKKSKDAAKETVSDVVYEVGDPIVKKGDIVTEAQIELLKSSSLIRGNYIWDYSLIFGLGGQLLLIIIVYFFTMSKFFPNYYNDNRFIIFIIAEVLLTLVLSQAVKEISYYLVPAGVISISMLMVFNPIFAVYTGMFCAVLFAVCLQVNFDIFIYFVFFVFAGVFSVKNVYEKTDIYKGGIFIGTVNAFVISMISVLRASAVTNILPEIILSFFSGIISSFLAVMFVKMLGSIINIVTPSKITALSNPSNDLMQKMITLAPGTYHHSLLVGNLAESAAKKIGANYVLTRVGAYYHDIGKILNPLYFMENQIGNTNPHDEISPEESSKIIRDHISDGIKLGNKYRLPHEIMLFIKTHHGTTLTTFFYYKAKAMGLNPIKEEYSYPGPKPNMKETSLVMLADSCEAATRALKEHTQDNIKEVVDKIFNQKISDNQLENCSLTLSDLQIAKECFAEVLIRVYHERVSYPNEEEQ